MKIAADANVRLITKVICNLPGVVSCDIGK